MKDQAIALCRVSTPEQKLSNSLNRQAQSVIEAAKKLNVKIIDTFSGDASSKVGKNFNRPDLVKAYSIAKANKRVGYLIVDEVDRFMRSTEEMFYWITRLKYELGVKVYFASNPELNFDTAQSRLMLSLDGFKAEGSNEERQKKSINGHVQAIKEGRYTFPPKTGYRKGERAGIHVRDPETFTYFQVALKEIIAGVYNPTEALNRLMKTNFGNIYKRFEMDKFRRFATDPYYAGIVEINKQVIARNENGLHEKMITIDEHEQLKAIFNGTYKSRGKAKHYNPEFPMSKILECSECGGKFTGAKKNNGVRTNSGNLRKKINYYFKYRCRDCKKEYHRDEVHHSISQHLDGIEPLNELESFKEALETVWRQKNGDKLKQVLGLKNQLNLLQEKKSNLVMSISSTPDDLKSDIHEAITIIKQQILDKSTEIENSKPLTEEMKNFIEYGMNYTKNLKEDYWQLDYDERKRCQQLLFKGELYINSMKKVDTPKLSSFYRYKIQKTSPKTGQNVSMVELARFRPSRPLVNSLDDYKLISFSCLRSQNSKRTKCYTTATLKS